MLLGCMQIHLWPPTTCAGPNFEPTIIWAPGHERTHRPAGVTRFPCLGSSCRHRAPAKRKAQRRGRRYGRPRKKEGSFWRFRQNLPQNDSMFAGTSTSAHRQPFINLETNERERQSLSLTSQRNVHMWSLFSVLKATPNHNHNPADRKGRNVQCLSGSCFRLTG